MERKTRGRRSGRWEAEEAPANTHEHAGVSRASRAHGKEVEYGRNRPVRKGRKEGRRRGRVREEHRLTV